MEWTENVTGLQHIGIPTEDIDASATFYRRLGFETALETENEGDRVCFLRLKNLTLEVYETEKAPAVTGPLTTLLWM